MTKIVQIAGGNADSEDVYVGEPRELRADMSNKELRLHDGATEGGHRFLSRDANDERYQEKSAELDGFNFPAAARGILARVASGVYKLRQFAGTAGQIVIQYPDAKEGNPTFSLAETQTGEHRWTDQQVFDEVVEFNAGILGDVEGDTTGTHTGNVVGNVQGDLEGNTEGTHTGPQVGSVDARGKTLLLDAQIEFAMLTDTAKSAMLEAMLDVVEPIGLIPKLYLGSIQDIPDRYSLCDGSGGMPDLRGRIPRMYTEGFAILATAGTLTHTHTGTTDEDGSHTHGVNVAEHVLTLQEIPSHTHLNGVVDKNDALFNHGSAAAVPTKGGSIDGNSSSGVVEGRTTGAGGGLGHTHTGSTAENSGSHDHGLTTNPANNLPPVFGVAFIIRTS